jgi:hypothetical protein
MQVTLRHGQGVSGVLKKCVSLCVTFSISSKKPRLTSIYEAEKFLRNAGKHSETHHNFPEYKNPGIIVLS